MGRKMLERVEKTCKHCNQMFEVRPSKVGQPFCSGVCYHAWQAEQRPIVTCAQCGRTFPTNPRRVKEFNFCNRACTTKWRQENWKGKGAPQYKGIRVQTCPICGREFERVNTGQRTCSPPCAGKWRSKYFAGSKASNWRGGKVTVHCANCSKAIKRIRSELERSENFFCDVKCRGQWQVVHMVGENHPNWKGGWEYNYGPNWDEQRRRARKRNNYTCQHCGKRQEEQKIALDVHHIIPFREFGYIPAKNDNYKQANRLTNLITLCPSCHMKAEWGTIPLQPHLL